MGSVQFYAVIVWATLGFIALAAGLIGVHRTHKRLNAVPPVSLALATDARKDSDEFASSLG